jgi:hypothetical protein
MRKPHLFTCLILSLFIAVNFAQAQYTGIFKANQDSTEYSFQLDWMELQEQIKVKSSKGFELIDLEVTTTKSEPVYSAIWKEGSAKATISLVPGWDSLVILKRQMAADTFLMQDIEAFTHKGESHFLAIWTPGNDKHKVRKLKSWEGLTNDYEELRKRGYEMVDIEGYTAEDGETQYLAIYHKRIASQRTHLYRSSDAEAFNIDKVKRNKSGYQLFDFEHFEKREVPFYFGLYAKTDDGGSIITASTLEDFKKEIQRLKLSNNWSAVDIDYTPVNDETER